MKLILDFDRVLFDHDKLKQDMEQASLERYYACPELWDYLNPADYIYDDVFAFLDKFPKKDLILLSAYTARIGPNAELYQNRKVLESGITKWVSEAIIMDGPKSPYIKPYTTEEVVFVDDKRMCVEEVCRSHPAVCCIQLLRPRAERTKNDVEENDLELPIHIVTNLAEVDDIIKEI